MSSQTSTCSTKPGHVGGPEEQVGAERHAVAGDVDGLAALVVAGREVAPLVELAVGRQVGLRGDAEDAAAVDDDAAVVDAGALLERGADDEHGPQVGGGLGDPGERVVDGVEERVLQEQVVDGVAGEAQLGEDRERHALVVEVAQPAR